MNRKSTTILSLPRPELQPEKTHRLRRCEEFFLRAGLLGSATYVAVLLLSNLLQDYYSWQFDQALLGRRVSFVYYIDHVTYRVWKRIVLEPTFKPARTRTVEQNNRRPSDSIVTRSPHEVPDERLPIGRLQIPAVDLSVMVLNGTDDWILSRGVGRIEGTALPGETGNLGIAGHRDRYFRVLRKIREGDEIILTTNHGTYRYSVADTDVVSPDDTSVLRSSAKPSLTLVTCYPFYYIGHSPKRFIVKANLITETSPSVVTHN